MSLNDFAARGLVPARRILLGEGGGGAGRGCGRFVGVEVTLGEGDTQSWVTVTRTGKFWDPRYGDFEITLAMLQEMVRNFDRRTLGQDVFIDVAHAPNDGSAGKVLKLSIEGTKLRALVQWTPFGLQAIRERGFTYLSADYHEDWQDNEQRQRHGCVLLGAGLTLRPVIKHLDRVQLSADGYGETAPKTAINPTFIRTEIMNKHLKALREKLLSLGMTEEQIKPLLAAAEKQLAALGDDEAKCLAVVETFTSASAALADQVKKLSAEGKTVTLSPTITLGAPAAPDAAALAAAAEAAMRKLLADQAAAAQAEQQALGAKQKLLSDTLAADKGLADDARAKLLDELKPLVTSGLSDDQVKALAQFALSQASRSAAAAQLASLGYQLPAGSVHITVDSSNAIKALQQQVDRRLGLDNDKDTRRFQRTGGQLLADNRAFAEKALAQFDAIHGERLHKEHKLLAAGTGQIGDFAVPAVFERTVLREALYQLTGLSLVNVGTAAFASVVQIPYSYRDTTAAGINNTRTYELQGIRNAGVIQTFEEARPIPQKLAFKLSNEMRYLLAAAPIDFDPLAENVRNVIRIVGEDTDREIHHEVLNASERALTATVTDTLTAQVNGTNRIFVTTQFPVVRPRRVFDLKGAQVGNTEFPITVTLNSVARSEYVAGVTLSAGLYWIMDYNLGEIRFVNEAGVLQTPTNGWVLTVAYTYTLNVARMNLDITSPETKLADVYDRMLTLIGGRKVVIENDRYYTANMLLMSGAIDNALGQATTFQANASRPGTGLNADGSVGIVKGVPAFNTRAPGLNTGDVRVLVGERGNTRFRMLRPFQMADMEQTRDANGNFVGARDNYGEQFIALHTPTQLRNSMTSLVLFSSTARVARAS